MYIFWFLHQTTTFFLMVQHFHELYIFWFLHQTTTQAWWLLPWMRCISFDSYIKPQLDDFAGYIVVVVYLLIPTSNHNSPVAYLWWSLLYIFWFLHQTTTRGRLITVGDELYIFWFLHQTTTLLQFCSTHSRCISFDSYIKPQLEHHLQQRSVVVYLLIPTSNHNSAFNMALYVALYIFWFLHQTTTSPPSLPSLVRCISFDSYIKPQLWNKVYLIWTVVYLLIPTSNHNLAVDVVVYSELYIFWFLHQTTTLARSSCTCLLLYIFWFLHQTTTKLGQYGETKSCISFDSYIKPQLATLKSAPAGVVYLLIPTSNHNLRRWKAPLPELYIFWFLHQTTTMLLSRCLGSRLYIFWFLHQTTTIDSRCMFSSCCISFDSYIKPQLKVSPKMLNSVVYLLIPTSNHNFFFCSSWCRWVVYLLIPTSNHNCLSSY